MRDLFLAFLAQHDDGAWLRAVERVESAIHPVDRAATRVWFHFYPLALQHLMARPDASDLARRMTLAGRWRLADQIDTSHRFLYGHRHWSAAAAVALEFADRAQPPGSLDLGALLHEAAARVADRTGAAPPVVLGITAIALRTLQQAGFEALSAAPRIAAVDAARLRQSPDAVVAERARRGEPRWWQPFADRRQTVVTFDEHVPGGSFPLIRSQHLTTAAGLDTRDYRAADPRCSEGPIPVHCRSCSCGTCWVGVLAGAEALAPVEARERDKLAECGVDVESSQPSIRLACMTQAGGPVTIVIPPWNGLMGRVLKAVAARTP